ncbi:MAG TPA: nuclear transport factor 2 family protein [Phycisphaerales bacterium]|nr:nuclear transport factor 2 family protein [Phycisphaerales bacterium]
MNNTMPQSETHTVAKRFHELCSAGKFDDAMRELYADDARHVEAMEMPGSPYKRITQGKPALLEMSERWNKHTTVHSCTVGAPLVNGDQFICEMKMDCTSSEGPMAGQRMQMEEQCLYTVKNGKIAEAKFFYGGC